MVSEETGLPGSFAPGRRAADGSGIDLATARNVKWVARLGTQTLGTPTVAGGKVFLGTNNGAPREPRYEGDRGILMCFDEATGGFLWQLVAPKLRGTGNFHPDYPNIGVCSTPTVLGDRLYVTTNGCEALCVDVTGLVNGNDGPFKSERQYVTTRYRRKLGRQPEGGYSGSPSRERVSPLRLCSTDADTLWRRDLIEGLDVWPHDATACSPLVYLELVYVCTANGVDRAHKRLPSPSAPSLVALDRHTGKFVAADDAHLGPHVFHGQWSSPSLAKLPGKTLVLFGGGDGFCYAFQSTPVPAPGGKVLRTVWKCDCNPPEYRARNGKRLPYSRHGEGPSEVIGTPVYCKNRVYVTIGQDTRHGPGKGALTCIDATRTGDLSKTGVVWRYTDLNRSFCTPSVVDGLVFVGDVRGVIHCLDAETGRRYWVHETGGQMMSSTLVADGKVYAGNGRGLLTVLAAGKQRKVLSEVRLDSALHATPVAANGVLFVASQRYLYAVRKAAR
jgi:outer membrane protein assembly factor BamB